MRMVAQGQTTQLTVVTKLMSGVVLAVCSDRVKLACTCAVDSQPAECACMSQLLAVLAGLVQ